MFAVMHFALPLMSWLATLHGLMINIEVVIMDREKNVL